MLVISAVNGLHNFHANITRHRPPLNKWTNVQISQATIQSHHHYTLIQSMVEGQVDSTNSVIVLKTVWLKMASSDPGAFPRRVLVEDLDRWGGSFFGQEPVGNRVQRCEGKKYSFSRFILKCIKTCFTFSLKKVFASDPWHLAQPGSIRNLTIQTKGSKEIVNKKHLVQVGKTLQIVKLISGLNALQIMTEGQSKKIKELKEEVDAVRLKGLLTNKHG